MTVLVYLLNLLWVALSLGAFAAVTLSERHRRARPSDSLLTTARHTTV